MDRDALVERLRRSLARHDDIACAYLFGSRAKGSGVREGRTDPLERPAAVKAFAPSDVDVAVLWAKPPDDPLEASGLALAAELEDALGLDVQVIALDRASPELAHVVRRDGILLVDRHPAIRIRFEVRSRRDYFDILPHLHRYRRHGVRP